jgi:hypothetical protein
LGGTPAALASDQLMAGADSSNDKWLNNSTRPYRASQFLESLLPKARARLIGARINQIDVDLKQTVIRS